MRTISIVAGRARRCIALGAAVSLLASLPTASATSDWNVDDLQSKRKTWSQSIHFTLQEENFAELEKWLHEVRFETRRTADGHTLLPVFYDALVNIVQTSPSQRLDIYERQWIQYFAKWSEKYPTSAAPHIAHARFYLARAWRARGHGFENSVSADGHTAFENYLNKALQYLRANSEIASTDPEYFNLLAKVEFLLTGKHATLFDRTAEAMANFPEYVFIFPDLARYLLPKWHGTPEMFAKWAEWALQAGAKSDGTGLVARIYWTTGGGPFEYEDIREMGPNWPILRQAFADEMLHFPHWESATRFLTVACKARDSEQVDKFFVALQKNDATARRFVGTSAAYCKKIGGTARLTPTPPPPP